MDQQIILESADISNQATIEGVEIQNYLGEISENVVNTSGTLVINESQVISQDDQDMNEEILIEQDHIKTMKKELLDPSQVQIYADASQISEIDANHLVNIQQDGTYMVEDGVIVQPENIISCNPDDNYESVTLLPNQEAILQSQEGDQMSYILIVSDSNGQTTERIISAESITTDMSVYDFKDEKTKLISIQDSMIHDGVHIQNMNEDTEEELLDGDPREGQQQFMCNYCSFVTTRRALLTQHQQLHVDERASAHIMQAQLMCNYCNYTSPKRYLLTRHMKTHSEDRPHLCTICERGFKTIASLTNHINTHTGVRPHKCKECDSAFTTSGELVRHVRYRHTYEKPHKCPECDYSSVELSKLKRHIRSHTGERPYQCPHCVYASPDTYKLKRHLRIHTGERPYECSICNARFTQSNSLKAHKLIHTGDKPIFQCELCPTTCGRKTDLKIHVLKLHTSNEPMQCKKCGKSFPDRYTYKIHTKTHEGEKCFKCELCSYAALSQRHLESHILTHTGEKPYHCTECVQSFRQKQLLRRHKNLYHTPDYQPPTPKDKNFRCNECRKTFANKGNLLRHMLLHDPENSDYQHQLAQLYATERTHIEYTHEDGNGGEYIKCDSQILTAAEGQHVQVLLSEDGQMNDQPIYVQVMPVGSMDPEDIIEVTEIIEPMLGIEQEAIHMLVAASEQQQRSRLMRHHGVNEEEVITANQIADHMQEVEDEEEEEDDDDEDDIPLKHMSRNHIHVPMDTGEEQIVQMI